MYFYDTHVALKSFLCIKLVFLGTLRVEVQLPARSTESGIEQTHGW